MEAGLKPGPPSLHKTSPRFCSVCGLCTLPTWLVHALDPAGGRAVLPTLVLGARTERQAVRGSPRSVARLAGHSWDPMQVFPARRPRPFPGIASLPGCLPSSLGPTPGHQLSPVQTLRPQPWTEPLGAGVALGPGHLPPSLPCQRLQLPCGSDSCAGCARCVPTRMRPEVRKHHAELTHPRPPCQKQHPFT